MNRDIPSWVILVGLVTKKAVGRSGYALTLAVAEALAPLVARIEMVNWESIAAPYVCFAWTSNTAGRPEPAGDFVLTTVAGDGLEPSPQFTVAIKVDAAGT